jgi:hypothetical protein
MIGQFRRRHRRRRQAPDRRRITRELNGHYGDARVHAGALPLREFLSRAVETRYLRLSVDARGLGIVAALNRLVFCRMSQRSIPGSSPQ